MMLAMVGRARMLDDVRWVSATVFGLCLLALPVCAQSVGYAARTDLKEIPSYELVSIHKTEAGADNNGTIHDDPDGLTANGMTLAGLIVEAYGFSLGQATDKDLSGLPGWGKSERFTIRAKVDSEDAAKLKALDRAETMMVAVRSLASRTPSPRMVMLQRLLEDRFKVKLHYEQHEVSLYEMVAAKSGIKLQEAHPKDPEQGSMEMSNGKLTGQNVPMSFIPMILAIEVGRPVQDKTGTGGNYDFELHWSRPEDTKDSGAAAEWPALFTAVQEQMGLKLQPGKGQVWMIVVDHAELPTEN